MNLAHNLAASAKRRPDHVALRSGDESWTYAGLADAAARFAGHLRSRGIGAGDRVALTLPNIPAFAVVYYGTLWAGAVAVPMNPLFRTREVDWFLRDSGASLLVALGGSEPAAAARAADVEVLEIGDLPAALDQAGPVPLVEADDEDTAVLLYTSGTTDTPKGAELRHRNLQSNQQLVADTLVEVRDGDVVMGCLPFFHVFGMTCTLNMSIAAGTTVTMLPRFDPAQALRVMAAEQATVFFGVPTMYGAILAAADDVPDADVSALRVCVSGGSSMPVDLMRRFEERFGCIILEGYGLSETSPVAAFNHPHRERKPGSIGTPVRGVEMRLAPVEAGDDAALDRIVAGGDVGEILIRGENVMRGYWGRPDSTSSTIDADGWLRTGDLARVDDDGYFFIVDRTKDIIIRGGYNVYPREVEEVLYSHPDVEEAAVVGLRHDHYGEEVGAYVVARAGRTPDAEALRAFVKEQVAAYKYPRVVRIVDSLPKGATGKILKRELPREL